MPACGHSPAIYFVPARLRRQCAPLFLLTVREVSLIFIWKADALRSYLVSLNPFMVSHQSWFKETKEA